MLLYVLSIKGANMFMFYPAQVRRVVVKGKYRLQEAAKIFVVIDAPDGWSVRRCWLTRTVRIVPPRRRDHHIGDVQEVTIYLPVGFVPRITSV